MAMPQSPGLILDTHADIQELVEAGMPQAQAETIVRQHARLLELNLATKADIAELRAELKSDTAELTAELKTTITNTNAPLRTAISDNNRMLDLRIADFKTSLIKWLFAVHIGTATIILAILTALGVTK